MRVRKPCRKLEQNPGAMAAVLKLPNGQVEQLCGEFSQVWPVNYNCPGQLVVAGEKKSWGPSGRGWLKPEAKRSHWL